ncbi:HAD family hydrolase [Chelatococcus asaccharovorans]|uniref:Beta-phosphoglucomutase n=1 Tax=Chelatococcus asaccharovorans TaxID=28210 RepID=A0A2V3U930_9HYPH|nr:HAD-IA family hydrolase [Chelatococcus asaccharovorans]MBS7705803.1 HAD-IA family hydrolase [Chelatococcus asaccharovorans]PXW58824.1 beta-phosphoglucomutase [Chelatococcus asaccharovorans]CAH1657926.1 Beta-phosphoglucomutase [Chelatococcus asaccharovorans]CAH1684651.1 Beta-phosphoglucomutase [Chelatococcus asaccharovorans]
MTPATLLFDLDGTLVNTDHLHYSAFQDLLGDFDRTMEWDVFERDVIGRANADIMAGLFPALSPAEQEQMAARKEALFRSKVQDLEPTQGLPDLLDFALARGIGCAVVTNAPRDNAMLLLKGLRLEARFEAVVIADELPAQKPDPLPYLTGLRLLKGDARRALAFEDSRSGVTAAAAAGILTVGLTTSLGEAALMEAGASLAVADFKDPRLNALIRDHLGVS